MTRSLPALVLTLLPLPALAAPGGPPPTAREPVEETLHGVTVTDPYRWLEGDAEGNPTERVGAWTDAQNAYTRGVLDAIPGRAKVAERLRELMTIGAVGLPRMRGERVFYSERKGDQDQAVLYLREGGGPPRTLLDPNALDAAGLISLDWYEPSPDGTRLAFGLSRAGDENSTLHLLDVATGRWLADEIAGKVRGCDWEPDGRGFFYRQLRDVKDPYSARIRYHRVGEHHRQDPVLFEQHSTTYGPYAWIDPAARWLLLGYYTGTASNDLWVVDLDRWRRTGEFARVEVVVGADAKNWGPVLGDTLFLNTTLDAPNGRVVAVDLAHPQPERWREVVPEREGVAIEGVSLARGQLVVTSLQQASTRIERFRLDGTALGPLELPGIGSASIGTHPDRTDAFVSFQSFNEPRSIYRVDLVAGTRELWARPEVPVDPSQVVVEQVTYPSRDGTPVTMFLVRKKDAKKDGERPTLLYGYGGFDVSLTPRFSATLFQWFEAGGVYAVANLRGGGEYGEAWHKAGQLERKQNVFDDFIAAAEHLVKSGWTRPERLAIAGGSNGGLLTGAVLVQRPDLCRAAVSSVPLLDMLRYHRFLMARFWVPEYGSAEDAEQFAFLRAYSPYHNVKAGTKYPAVLLTAGENDSRVHPLHARKMAARLQAATASEASERPVLLWVERAAGHGSGKPLSLRLQETVDERVFLMWQLGLLGGPGEATGAAQEGKDRR